MSVAKVGSKRKAWDEEMQRSGARIGPARPAKRASGRQTVLSKAMKVVDEETRTQVRSAHLDALEADNYAEEAVDAGDDDFQLEEDSPPKMGAGRPPKRRAAAAAGSGGGPSSVRKKPGKGRGVRRYRSLDHVLYELAPSAAESELLDARDEGGSARKRPTYLTVAAGPSGLPERHFCSVCGYYGTYTCTRCGARFCSITCCEHHKETRCLKFAA